MPQQTAKAPPPVGLCFSAMLTPELALSPRRPAQPPRQARAFSCSRDKGLPAFSACSSWGGSKRRGEEHRVVGSELPSKPVEEKPVAVGRNQSPRVLLVTATDCFEDHDTRDRGMAGESAPHGGPRHPSAGCADRLAPFATAI